MAKKSGLGMGLEALFDDNRNETPDGGKQTLRISEIEPNKEQPRSDFDDEAIATLADSIREHGLIQPLLVRPMDNGSYQLVAGERRWRACRMLGMSEVPVVIRELSDSETMQIALIENVIREDLNPVEEALAYKSLMDDYGMTQEEVAKTVGKSRAVIGNAVRILNLPDEILELLRKKELTMGHGRALLSVADEEKQLELAKKAAGGLVTVRQIEKAGAEKKEPEKPLTPTFLKELELSLHEALGRRVKLSGTENKGTIQLEFYSREDLNEVVEALTKSK